MIRSASDIWVKKLFGMPEVMTFADIAPPNPPLAPDVDLYALMSLGPAIVSSPLRH